MTNCLLNYEVTNRKLYMSEDTPLYENEQKERKKHIMETTEQTILDHLKTKLV